MNETRDLLERVGERFLFPDRAFERLERRRERRRRNQRIAAGVVGVAVFAAAIWIVMTGGPFDRAGTPAAPGGATAVTGPMESTGPTGGVGVGLIGLAPEGAAPSTPTRGELVLSFVFGHTDGDVGRFTVHLYADGRLIKDRLENPYTGLREQRLTPEGVQLLLAEVLSTGLFDRDRELLGTEGLHYGGVQVRDGDRLIHLSWGDAGFEQGDGPIVTTPTPEQVRALERLDARLADPASWLPESAWEDRETRAYGPARYSVCYMGRVATIERPRILELVPAPAEDLLSGRGTTRGEVRGPFGSIPFWCSDVTTEESRVLVEALEDAGARRNDPSFLSFRFQPDAPGNAIDIVFEPLLPHQT